MSTNALLVAGIVDVISALVPVIVFVIWVIGQIMSRANQAPAKPVRGPGGQPAPGQPVQGQPAPGRPVVDANATGPAAPRPGKTIMDEIEQFVVRARKQLEDQARGGKPAEQPVMAEVVTPRRTIAPPAQAVDLSRRHEVDSHVRQHLSPQAMNAHVDALGDAVEVADDKMEAHLHQKFDHRLGSLAIEAPSPELVGAASASSSPTMPAIMADSAARPAPAVDFAALLANAQNVQQAIVLNEILQRPVDRW